MKQAGLVQLPTNWRKQKLEHMKWEIANGMSQEHCSQEYRDLLHMETSEKNLQYWKDENQSSETDERCLHCQAIARSMIVALRAKEPSQNEMRVSILANVMDEAACLPQTH